MVHQAERGIDQLWLERKQLGSGNKVILSCGKPNVHLCACDPALWPIG